MALDGVKIGRRSLEIASTLMASNSAACQQRQYKRARSDVKTFSAKCRLLIQYLLQKQIEYSLSKAMYNEMTLITYRIHCLLSHWDNYYYSSGVVEYKQYK